MIFHENHLLAEDSHEISYLFFFRKFEKMSQNLSSAAVVLGALRVNNMSDDCPNKIQGSGEIWYISLSCVIPDLIFLEGTHRITLDK